MRITCLFYCLSGFVSLAYQVAWFRIFVDRFGSTNLTFGLVLCNFIGGLGVGALASERVCDSLGRRLRIDHPLRLYGLIELLIAVSVLLTALTTLIPPAAWGHFPYRLSQGVYHLTISYQLARIAVATGCVFIPAFLMGVTFAACFNTTIDSRPRCTAGIRSGPASAFWPASSCSFRASAMTVRY